MKQVVSVVQFYHQNSTFFPVGRLESTNIYISKELNVLVDPGLYYFKNVPNLQEQIGSGSLDVLNLGKIFCQLVLLVSSPQEIHGLINNEELEKKMSQVIFEFFLNFSEFVFLGDDWINF
jgi:hypothetical protein